MSISQNTRVTLTVGSIIALVAVGWRAGTMASEIKAEVTELRRDIQRASAASWTLSDMERWSYQLKLANNERLLTVPDARAVKTSN